jgi:hypothetical protein
MPVLLFQPLNPEARAKYVQVRNPSNDIPRNNGSLSKINQGERWNYRDFIGHLRGLVLASHFENLLHIV